MALIPDRFRGDFLSELPPADVFRSATTNGRDFGERYTANLVKWTQFEAARLIDGFGILPEAVAGAKQLFGASAGHIGGTVDFDAQNVLSDALEGFASAAAAMGAFDDVPIVGWVIGIGLSAWEIGRTIWKEQHRAVVQAVPFGYSETEDQYWQREVLRKIQAGKLTDIFLPWNDASGGVEVLAAELLNDSKVKQKIAVPRGKEGGLGYVPGTSANSRGWTFDTRDNPLTRAVTIPWLAYMPGTQQSGLVAWSTALANGRPCFAVDSDRIETAWSDYWRNMRLAAQSGKNKKARARLFQAIAPTSYMTVAAMQKIPADYRQVTSMGWGISGGYWEGAARYELTMEGVTRYVIERQLRMRQLRHLDTLTVAYVSEGDPAFRNAQLAKRLKERRKQLLADPEAAAAVDLQLVPDTDYRKALATHQGVGGIKGAEGGPKAPSNVRRMPFRVPDPIPDQAVAAAIPFSPHGIAPADSGVVIAVVGGAALVVVGGFLAWRKLR